MRREAGDFRIGRNTVSRLNAGVWIKVVLECPIMSWNRVMHRSHLVTDKWRTGGLPGLSALPGGRYLLVISMCLETFVQSRQSTHL